MYVFLGRFSPFHNGHKKVVDQMIAKYGLKKSLVMVGSSNVVNEKTPFTYKKRLKMIKSVFPDIKVLPIADVNNDEDWLENISLIEKRLKTKFIFVGGSEKDLEVLSRKFPTEVVVDRFDKKKISGTLVRGLIKNNETQALKEMLPHSVYKMVIKY